MKGKLCLDVVVKKPTKANAEDWQGDLCFCCDKPSGPKFLDLYRLGEWVGQLCHKCFTAKFTAK